MNNPEKLATQGTQDTDKQTKNHTGYTRHRTKINKENTTQGTQVTGQRQTKKEPNRVHKTQDKDKQ